ncbi:hypothetical protein LICSK_07510 [Leptospira interrogans serovar Copenhageni]|nr:hypothetical protein LICSK_07510 [Leptospira interrogans serovar Copenhageni]
MLSFPYFWVGVEAVRFGKFFSIRKTYFLQVKRLILVGTLEKCAFLILLILKSYSTYGVGYGSLLCFLCQALPLFFFT